VNHPERSTSTNPEVCDCGQCKWLREQGRKLSAAIQQNGMVVMALADLMVTKGVITEAEFHAAMAEAKVVAEKFLAETLMQFGSAMTGARGQ
jgi:hypothetical protein